MCYMITSDILSIKLMLILFFVGIVNEKASFPSLWWWLRRFVSLYTPAVLGLSHLA